MTVPPWVPDQETKPAPMPLLLVQSFVNTWDGDDGSDLLLDPPAARSWLTAAGLWNAGRAPEPAELDLARRVRESIRAMLAANGGGPPPGSGELHALQAAAQASRPALQVGPGGQVGIATGSAVPLQAGLVTLLLAIRDAQRDGTWQRLKACGNPDCLWAFYDRSHSRAGAWCDMATCGNRIKNRRLRQRQRLPGTRPFRGPPARSDSAPGADPATTSLPVTDRGGAHPRPSTRTADLAPSRSADISRSRHTERGILRGEANAGPRPLLHGVGRLPVAQGSGDCLGGQVRRDWSMGLISPTSLPSGSAAIAYRAPQRASNGPAR